MTKPNDGGDDVLRGVPLKDMAPRNPAPLPDDEIGAMEARKHPLFKRDVGPLDDRIAAAIDRIVSGHGCMRIPADPTDPDVVLVDCHEEIKRLRSLSAARAASTGAWLGEALAALKDAVGTCGDCHGRGVYVCPSHSAPCFKCKKPRAELERLRGLYFDALGIPASMGSPLSPASTRDAQGCCRRAHAGGEPCADHDAAESEEA